MESSLLKKRLSELERDNEKLTDEHQRAKKNECRDTGFALIVFGVVTLIISYFTYNNSTLASILLFAGLGTTFIGILSIFLTPENFFREEILEKSNLSSIIVINNIIQELHLHSKGIHAQVGNKIKVIIPNNPDYKPGKEISERTFQIGDFASIALVIIPLGYSLLQMVEKGGADWSDLNQSLNEVFVEGLELAHSVEMIQQDNDITVKVNKPLYMNICAKISTEVPRMCEIGCPFCSLMACILVRSTGKNVVIEYTEQGKNGITTRFKLS